LFTGNIFKPTSFWYTFANNIFKEFDLNIENHSNIDKSFEKVKYSIKTQLRKVATEKYRNKLKEKISSYSDESKLFLYSKRKRPSSAFEAILHAFFLSPKMILQYLVLFFSYDVL
jgi:hypothetical protein